MKERLDPVSNIFGHVRWRSISNTCYDVRRDSWHVDRAILLVEILQEVSDVWVREEV